MSSTEVVDAIPPPTPFNPPNIVPIKASKPKRDAMARPGLAKRGQRIQLVTNHFEVTLKFFDDYLYHYSVNLKYDNDLPVNSKIIGRKAIDKFHQTYGLDLDVKFFAYDGEKSLFTLGSLPRVTNEYVVVEDLSSNKTVNQNGNDTPGESDRKRMNRACQPKEIKVEINFSAKNQMQAIALALRGEESENSQEALPVLDIILRQHAAKKGCLLAGQSFFHYNPSNCTDIGGGVEGCPGFHSSSQTTQDVTATLTVKPGPIVDFLKENQCK